MTHSIGNYNVDLLEDSFVKIVHQRALHHPDKIAFSFLADRSEEKTSISFSELDTESRNIAAILQKTASKGERAILLYPSGKDYIAGFLGCLYSGIVAVPAYPPDPSRLNNTLKRLQTIIDNSQAKLALTTSQIYNTIKKLFEVKKEGSENLTVENKFQSARSRKDYNELQLLAEKMINSLIWIQTDICEKGNENNWSFPEIKGDSLAYLQYTSGSTGSPNGVMITHRNILVNSKMIASAFETTEEHEGIIWLPMYHDMGLIGGILQPLFTGFKCTLMSPLSFLAWPIRWLKEISKCSSSVPVVSGGPNFAYELCTKRITSEQIKTLDLSRWVIAFSGSEPVRWKTIEEFSEKFAPAGFNKEVFYPCYGLAEATLFVSGVKKTSKPAYIKLYKKALEKNIVFEDISSSGNNSITLVGCGYPREDGVISIVDPETKQPCTEDNVGEIWFSSQSVAQGYWNKPNESSISFKQNILSDRSGREYLRTGDLGFIRENQLYITGRLKDLIIIRGKNHYPQDIEYTVEKSHSAIRQSCTAAFSVEKNGREELVVVAEVGNEANLDYNEIFDNINNMISTEHELQIGTIVLIKQKTILKTSSGKIQRNAIKNAFLKGSLDVLKLWQASSIDEDNIDTKEVVNAGENFPAEKRFTEFRPGNKLSHWIINNLASKLKISHSEIDPDKPFFSYGIDSVMAVEMASELEKYTGKKISPTIVWEYSTINKLVKALDPELQEPAITVSTAKEQPSDAEQIAVIGMACRFPGACNPQEFWNLLLSGTDVISEIPKDRWNIDEFYSEDPDSSGKMSTRWGGFIKDIDKFDTHFFGISPREALQMDPQQRQLLEVLWEAFENSFIIPTKLAGSRTGVFIGISNPDYSHFQFGNFDNIDVYTGTGNSFSISANRISYLFDLHGPSMAVDTACSSSLVAAHLAAQSLLRRESDMAIVGGVNAVLCPDVNIALSKGRMLSPDGHCKTFDADANGYVRSEGCGVIILKRLSDAIKDGNNILAILKGSAINQDGRSNGLTAPNKTAQQEVIKEALKNAGLTIEQVGYIEAHGTGTILGDPIEIEAISNVFKSRINKTPLIVGSVKSNIGHLESAAGIAGLIKVILMLKNRIIPANLNFNKLNPHIELINSQVQIASKYRKWENNEEKRIAGVSSFGFGGVNAHVLLEEFEEPFRQKHFGLTDERPRHILTASAKDENILLELANKYLKDLAENENMDIADLCYSANIGRIAFDYRLSITGESKEKIREELQRYINKESSVNINTGKSELKGRPRIAFLFTGQGAQYVNMAKLLYETHPLFKEIINTCNEILKRYMDKPLLEVMFSKENSEEINNTAYTQPALFVLQYALSKLWVSWGVKPDYLIGHSIGEYAAACMAEVFKLEDALMLVSARGRLMQSLPRNGEMAAVFTDRNSVEKIISDFKDKVSIAGVNGPSNTVISGESSAVRQIIKKLNESNIRSQFLNVSHAFHSPLMDPILDEFETIAGKVEFNPPRIPVISNLTGDIIARNQIPDSRYWRDQIRKPVLFAEGVYNLVRLKTDIFIEIGPNPTLIGMARNSVPDSKATWVASLKKGQDDWKIILDSLAKLYVKGVEIDWKGLDHYSNRKYVLLPNYPFKKERFWTGNGEKASLQKGSRQEEVKKINPLIHERILSPLLKETVFSSKIQLKNFKLLDDHRILGTSLMPMMGFVEMITSIVRKGLEYQNFIIRNLNVIEAMIVPPDKLCNIQVVLGKFENSVSSFKVYSAYSSDNNLEQEVSWKLNAAGEVHLVEGHGVASSGFDINSIHNGESRKVDTNEFYSALQSIGFEHGKSYRVLKEIHSKEKEAFGNCSISESDDYSEYSIHPGLLDAGVQLFLATFTGNDVNREIMNDIYLPSAIGTYNLYKSGEANLWVRTVRKNDLTDEKDNMNCDIQWYNEKGELVAEATDLWLKRTTTDVLIKYLNVNLDDLLYKLQWRQQQIPENMESGKDDNKRNWVIFTDHKGIGEQIISRLSGKGNYCYKISQGECFRKLKENCFEIRPDSPEDFQALSNALYSTSENNPEAIVYLWGFDEDSSYEKTDLDSIESTQNLSGKAILYLVQKMILSQSTSLPSLWLVTPGCHKVLENDIIENFSHSIAWGIGRVLSNENPDILCVMIDIPQSEISYAANNIIKEITTNGKETQIAFRDNKRYVARLTKINNNSAQMTGGYDNEALMERLEIAQKGTLGNLFINRTSRQKPGADEIEIEVKSTGLNFRDVINALGLYPGDPGFLGGECSGIVSKVGSDVKDLKIGDEVMGIVPGSFSNYAVTKAQLVVLKPKEFDFVEAATVPIAFLTAYYALNKLASISKGDKVLIHSATGGVGLAAVQLSQQAGAEVFATAGSDEKRDYLKSLGIKYIMNSRELDFADEVMNYTEGKGINIVLNSLNEEYIPKGLSILSPGGSFLEIGKVGIWDEDKVKVFRKDIQYFKIALDDLSAKNPSLVHNMLEELKDKFETGELKPLRTHRFSIENAEEAFRLMMKAKHIGKIVIEQLSKSHNELHNTVISENQNCDKSVSISSKSSYLITGGSGALGLELAGWLARKQAGQIILLSKSEPDESSKLLINKLITKGANILTLKADVTNLSELGNALKSPEIAYPVKGIIHGAGKLDDAFLMNQTWDKFEAVMGPKIKGAINLFKLFKESSLDFVLYMSSVAPILGSPGQANYASANFFLDSFSSYQRKLGMNVVSVNWGPWKEKGMSKKMAKSNYSGIKPLAASHALLILNKIFSENITDAAVMSIVWEDFAKNLPKNQLSSLYSENIRISEQKDHHFQKTELVTVIENALPTERKAKLIEFIQRQTLSVLGLSSNAEIDTQRPLQEMGMDSLMAIELKNRLTSAIGKDFPVAAVFNYPSIEALSGYILSEHMKFNGGRDSKGVVTEEQGKEEKKLALNRTLDEIEDLSDKAVEELLLKKLNQKEED